MFKKIILVDGNDKEVGTLDKIKAHQEGKLHRAFSVFVFDKKKRLLLQKRTKTKYHSAGLWSNTCCSHSMPGEQLIQSAEKRLREEMGFRCHLQRAFSFIYRAEFSNGLVEYELDHVFLGKFGGNPNPDSKEVAGYKYLTLKELESDISLHPDKYTAWLIIIIKDHLKHLESILLSSFFRGKMRKI